MTKTDKLRFLAAVVLVLAVATILVTPDSTDDIDGILHSHRMTKALAQISSLPIAALVLLLPSGKQSYLRFPTGSSSQSNYRLLCTYRC